MVIVFPFAPLATASLHCTLRGHAVTGGEAQRHLNTPRASPPQLSAAPVGGGDALLAVDRFLLLVHDVADELVEVLGVLGLGLAAQRRARLATYKPVS